VSNKNDSGLVLFEKRVKKESGNLARMTVFNEPIFDETKDRIFKGAKIPMQYYKIILWLNEAQELKATAFKMSQDLLVNHIRFDESVRLDSSINHCTIIALACYILGKRTKRFSLYLSTNCKKL